MSQISILGVRLSIATGEARLLDYLCAFMDAYEQEPGDIRPDKHVCLTVRRDALNAPERHTVVGVHRSKHAYWNFDAELHENSQRLVTWRSKGIEVELRDGALDVNVTVDPAVDHVQAGEALFHICRSLALYHRAGYRGNLLHASAVAFDDACVAFTGDVSAGKTTLLTESVFRYGARPLANDRVLVTADERPVAVSWPSYSSFCEGTLLNYPPLAAAAAAYEDDGCPFRTQKWERPLAPLFDKESKRVYPMSWFSEAAGVKFVRTRPLRVLVLSRLDPACAAPEVRRINLSDAGERGRVAAALRPCTFDLKEPSFLPWHGLTLPAGAPELPNLIGRLHQAGVAVFDFHIGVGDLELLEELFEGIR